MQRIAIVGAGMRAQKFIPPLGAKYRDTCEVVLADRLQVARPDLRPLPTPDTPVPTDSLRDALQGEEKARIERKKKEKETEADTFGAEG